MTTDSTDLVNWVRDRALPFWARHGLHADWGFVERLQIDGTPTNEPRRARLTARQVYCFATAPLLGADVDAARLVDTGLAALENRFVGADGVVIPEVDADGTPVRTDHDLYDVAFVLFGLAAAARHLPARGEIVELAIRVRDRLRERFTVRSGGYASTGTSGQLANPHMHLLEACLEWSEVDPTDSLWREMAAGLVELACTRMIDPETGALSEVFSDDWSRPEDRRRQRVEPGHQYEWAWLLLRWGAHDTTGEAAMAAVRLLEVGENYGLDRQHGVAIEALDGDLVPSDGASRLWAQTERAKALAAIGSDRLPTAIDSLSRFLRPGSPGLWYDAMSPEGQPTNAPVRASSLYHLTCAARYLQEINERSDDD